MKYFFDLDFYNRVTPFLDKVTKRFGKVFSASQHKTHASSPRLIWDLVAKRSLAPSERRPEGPESKI